MHLSLYGFQGSHCQLRLLQCESRVRVSLTGHLGGQSLVDAIKSLKTKGDAAFRVQHVCTFLSSQDRVQGIEAKVLKQSEHALLPGA